MTIKVDYLPATDRQTLGEDKKYAEQLLSRRVTVFFRPSNRHCDHDQRCIHKNGAGYSYVGIIAEYGNHASQKPPCLAERLPCVLKEERIISWSKLTAKHFNGAYQEVQSVADLWAYFQEKYQLAVPPVVVTRYRVAYLPVCHLEQAITK